MVPIPGGAAAVAAAVSWSQFLAGWDSGIIGGCLLYIIPDFKLEQNPQLQGAVIAATIAGAIFSSSLAGPCSDRFGRRSMVGTGGVIYTLAATIQWQAANVWVLIAGRAVVGTSIGIFSTVVPTYIAEISLASERGRLSTWPSLIGGAGLVIAYCANFAASLLESVPWRLLLGGSLLPGLMLVLLTVWLPESPRWLASKGRLKDCRHVLAHLRQREDNSEEMASILANLDPKTASPLEEWLIHPESEAAQAYAVAMEKDTAEDIPSQEEAGARAAMEVASQIVSYKPHQAWPHVDDLETPLVEPSATPIFEQTTILTVDWGSLPAASERRTEVAAEAVAVERQGQPIPGSTFSQRMSHALSVGRSLSYSSTHPKLSRHPSGGSHFSRLSRHASGRDTPFPTDQQQQPDSPSPRHYESLEKSGLWDEVFEGEFENPAVAVGSKSPMCDHDQRRSGWLEDVVQRITGLADPTAVLGEHGQSDLNPATPKGDVQENAETEAQDDEARWHCRHCESSSRLLGGQEVTEVDNTTTVQPSVMLEDLKTGECVEVVDMLEVHEVPVAIAMQPDGNELLVQKLGEYTAAAVPTAVLDTSPKLQDLLEPGVSRALMIGVALLVIQQAVGINAITFYAPMILRDSGVGFFFESHLGISASSAGIFGTSLIYVLMLPCTFRAMTIMDSAGRRFLLLMTMPLLVFALIALSGTLQFLPQGSLSAALSLGAVSLYMCAFTMGLGPIPTILASEVFPTRVRGICLTICLASAWVTNLIVSQSFPILKDSLGVPLVMAVYATICVFGLVFVVFYVPETKGLTLEMICDYLTQAATGGRHRNA